MPEKARGRVLTADGSVVYGTAVRVDDDYVTLVLDDEHGHRRTIDDGGYQMYLRIDQVTWLD